MGLEVPVQDPPVYEQIVPSEGQQMPSGPATEGLQRPIGPEIPLGTIPKVEEEARDAFTKRS